MINKQSQILQQKIPKTTMDDEIKQLFVALGSTVLKHSQLIEQQHLILEKYDSQFKAHQNKLQSHSLLLSQHENRLAKLENKTETKGNLDQPKVANEKRKIIWALNSKDQIFYRQSNSEKWNKTDGRLVKLSVCQDGRLWGVDATDDIFTRTGVYGSWQRIPGKLVDICALNNGEVWGINRQNQVFVRYEVAANVGWTKVPERPFPKRDEPNVQWINN